jgi:uncharacterized protein
VNPFSYQGPVDPSRLIDRRAELDGLQSAAGDRVAIRLAAPRRFGKTSVLDAHVAAMRAVGHRAVRVDLSKVATVGDVAARVAEAFSTLPADPGGTVRRWIGRLNVSAGVRGLRVRVGPSGWRPGADEARVALLELLDVPLRLYRADGELTVVCMDEFQDLLVADDALDGLVRSVIQHHGDAAAYVFAGSQPSVMRELFADRKRAFYGQARPLELGRLAVAEASAHVEALLSGDGLDGGSAVDELGSFTQGHPQRTVLLAHHLYNLLDTPEPPDDLAAAAIELALGQTGDAQQALWDGLRRVERIVCMALADGRAVTGSVLAREHRVARSTLREALERLLADERQVQRDGEGIPFLLDPLFAEWLRRR